MAPKSIVSVVFTTTVRRRGLLVTSALVLALASGSAAGAPDGVVVPVPSTPTTAPAFVGTPATAKPIRGVPRTPHNPHMAANGDSSIHNDGWQTDTYRRSGPLSHDPQTFSAAINGVCGSITYDSRGRIVSTCVGVQRALNLIDPETLDVIATYPLPGPPPGSQLNGNIFKNFGGGAYFFLNDKDQAVIGTYDGHFQVIQVGDESLQRVGSRLRVLEARGRRHRPLVLDRDRLPDRQGRLEDPRRRRARTEQQLRGSVDLADGHRLPRRHPGHRGDAGRLLEDLVRAGAQLLLADHG